MFRWLRSLVGSAPTAPVEPESPLISEATLRADDTQEINLSQSTIKVASVWEVADQYIVDNPAQTPFGVHALIMAGATNLMGHSELQEVCQKIQQHGLPDPINPTLRRELTAEELFDLLEWMNVNNIPQEHFRDEPSLMNMIRLFRS
ncbi:hypothetical protein SV7mr_35530 [Stieleria bergensis]|uniref:Uncharacterized protein n=2 Tax=Stieleria bergensis TaxID=2528025 RepID=A0A517SY90_9BACT|nr:hypothetical protein SV7mr_35530 [Planctomycetes bacterium SV_7m_r]